MMRWQSSQGKENLLRGNPVHTKMTIKIEAPCVVTTNDIPTTFGTKLFTKENDKI